MKQLRITLSPVGTSILSNPAANRRGELFQFANAQEAEISEQVLTLIENLKEKAIGRLPEMTLSEIRKASAEINGIIGIYGGTLPDNSPDIHYLIATDTYQGQVAAEIVRQFLQQYFPNTQIFTPTGLSTKNKSAFQTGIKELLAWCDKHLPGYRSGEYEIVFNLTGGFKSLQGYLNTIAMFYADRISYIFEQGGELITIPRLPIKLETALFEQYASQFLLLSQSEVAIAGTLLNGIPEIMLECYEEGMYILSDWGQLAWNNVKANILGKQLVPLPRIAYENSLTKEFKQNNMNAQKVKLQETLAKISCLLLENKGDIGSLRAGRGGGILYDNFTGPNSHLGHFRLGNGSRVSAEYKEEVLRIRHFGEHDYVEKNP